MTPTSTELTFSWTPATLVFGIAVVLITMIVSFLIWKRSSFSPKIGLLELLRILCVALVAVTLNQPEWKETFEPEEKPTIAVLWDVSKSMETADVVNEENPSLPLQKRSDTVTPLVDKTKWDALREKADVVFESFSSEEPEKPTDATDIGAALDQVAKNHANLRGVVLATDGDWNDGEPPTRAATRLRMREIPVFSVQIGSDTRLPDLAVTSFDVPTFAISGKAVRIPFTLSSSIPRDKAVRVQMKTDQGEELFQDVTIPAMGRVRDTFLWKPGAPGSVSLTLTLPSDSEERDLENNTITVPLAIRKEKIKVLLIESFPRWEYRYLRNALERDPGVEVNCLLFHPDIKAPGNGKGYLKEFPGPESLSSYDVVFLGDVGVRDQQLSEAQCKELKQLVATQASGLVFLPGFRGYQHSLESTELSSLLPVVLDQAQPRGWGAPSPGQLELTELGLRSLLTRLADSDEDNQNVWNSLPGFQWFAGIERAKAGSEVLATHSSESNRYGRIPLIVTKTYGTGKVLYMGTDGAWRWRKGVEDKYHYRFWGQVARWMAYQRNMASGDTMRLFFSPDRPQANDVLTLNANVMSVGGEPLRTATVLVQITAPSGKVDTLRLQPGGEDQWGLFTGNFTPSEPGEYQLHMTCPENSGMLDTVVTVQGQEREQIGQPARYDVLKEIASISRGEMLARPDLKLIQERISALPDPEPLVRDLKIWAHPAWIGALVLLLVIFWIGRKAIGAM